MKGTRSEIQTSSSEKTKSFGEVLEGMRKRREEETAVRQREREEMLREVKRLREEVMTTENDNTV